MAPLYTELSSVAQAAYAQLAEAALATQPFRSVADLSGSFATKTVKGHTYWYYQFTEPSGALRQIFVGPDNDAVRTLVARKQQPAASAALGPLVAASIALGCTATLPQHLRVV